MYRKVKLNIENLKHDYTIDTNGIVENISNGKVLKGTSLSKHNRYVKIHLDKFYALHRLVATHFIPNTENYEVINHIDGNRYNNSVNNLEWVTQKDNVLHAYRTKLKSNEGLKNTMSKLSEEQVIAIFKLSKTNLTARQIRDRLKLDVSICCIKLIRSGKNWSSVTSNI